MSEQITLQIGGQHHNHIKNHLKEYTQMLTLGMLEKLRTHIA